MQNPITLDAMDRIDRIPSLRDQAGRDAVADVLRDTKKESRPAAGQLRQLIRMVKAVDFHA